MINIAIYNSKTGQIRQSMFCPENMVDIQCQDGEEFYLNCPPDATHIIGNEPVAVAPPPYVPSADELLFHIRQARDQKLDVVDLKYCNAERWAAMTAEQRQTWSNYKKSLRDLPATCDPENPVWPVMPKP